jgi:hypothetical protein
MRDLLTMQTLVPGFGSNRLSGRAERALLPVERRSEHTMGIEQWQQNQSIEPTVLTNADACRAPT